MRAITGCVLYSTVSAVLLLVPMLAIWLPDQILGLPRASVLWLVTVLASMLLVGLVLLIQRLPEEVGERWGLW